MAVLSDAQRSEPASQRRNGLHPVWHLVIAVLVLALLQGFVVKLYAIPSESMEPTLQSSDRILVNRIAYVGAKPEPGDIVVFHADETWGSNPSEGDSAIKYALKWVGSIVGIGPGVEHTVVKRVIAVGGQTIECCSEEGAVLVDGVPLPPTPGADFPFTAGAIDCESAPASTRCFPPLIVPSGMLVVAGDNRLTSKDSLTQCRVAEAIQDCLLTVNPEDVVGEAIFIVTPFGRFGAL